VHDLALQRILHSAAAAVTAGSSTIGERLVAEAMPLFQQDQTERRDAPMSLGATSLATVMQMVANGYGVTLVPRVAVDVEVRDERVKLLRAWRRTSPRKVDFVALGQLVIETLGFGEPRPAAAGR
jgi:DNA-binding transcriptional LysR family regulator